MKERGDSETDSHRENYNMKIDTQGRWPCGDRGRDWSDIDTLSAPIASSRSSPPWTWPDPLEAMASLINFRLHWSTTPEVCGLASIVDAWRGQLT